MKSESTVVEKGRVHETDNAIESDNDQGAWEKYEKQSTKRRIEFDGTRYENMHVGSVTEVKGFVDPDRSNIKKGCIAQ
jgi:hypothetical protein